MKCIRLIVWFISTGQASGYTNKHQVVWSENSDPINAIKIEIKICYEISYCVGFLQFCTKVGNLLKNMPEKYKFVLNNPI